MRSAWSGKNKNWTLLCIIGIMLTFVPGCDDAPPRPGEGFYSYQGFRDWWRIPLKFPYQITIIDSFEQGYLEKYDPASLIAAPQCKILAENITKVGCDGKFAIFQQKTEENPYGILIYASGAIRNFSTGQDLADFIKRNYPDTPMPEMDDLETFYTLMWKVLDVIRRKNPQALDYDY